MKFLVVALCICSVASAQKFGQTVAKAAVVGASAPVVAANAAYSAATGDYSAPILKSEFDVNEQGYGYAYETGNGIAASATGTLKKVDDQNVIVSEGGYQYTAPDGTPVVVRYVADENGYHPESDVLPVAPEIPPQIARALQYIAEHPAPVEPTKKF